MKHTLRSNSWHFHLANFCAVNDIHPNDNVNICEYIRRVFRGILLVCFMGILVFAILFDTIYSIANVFSVMFLDGYEMQPVTYVTLFLYSMVGYMAYKDHRENIARNRTEPETPPGFLKLAYRKFKEKTCFIVSFKD